MTEPEPKEGLIDYTVYFEANRQLWNQRTPVHAKSDFYDLTAFKGGKSSLNQVELAELGAVRGKSLLHLQCHFGQDTLSWAREGAEATGMDFSEEAITLARQLNAELQLKARFVCANVYDLPQHLEGTFDIVFTSYGTIGWLPDLDKWAAVVAHFLKPGGTFYMVEFHPLVWMFDPAFEKIIYPYHNTGPIVEEQPGTYAEPEANLKQAEYGWNHSLSEVINALIGQGLTLQFLHEHPFSPYNCFREMEQGPDGLWRIPHLAGLIPMLFSLKATK